MARATEPVKALSACSSVRALAPAVKLAVPALADVFEYADRGRMLLWGSVFYGSFFVISVPVFLGVDEEGEWSLGGTLGSALGVGMGVFLVLDVWAKVIGGV